MENDNDIRKKEKKLDTNHWMCKIQKYTLGIDAKEYYMGYCPFFWMTILCIFLSPFILLFRAFIGVFMLFGKFLDHLMKKAVREKLETRKKLKIEEIRKIPLMPTDYIFVNLFGNEERYKERGYTNADMISCSDYMGMVRWTQCVQMGLWIEQNPDWKETHYPAAKARIDEARKKRELQAEKDREKEQAWEATKRKLISKGSFCGKIIFKIAAVIALAFVACSIYYAGYKLVTAFNVAATLQLFYITCFVLAFIILVKTIVMEIIYFIDHSESSCILYKDYAETELRVFFKPFAAIFKAIGWVFKTIVNIFAFCKEAVGMMYKEECPLILWGDETGPIEKRNKDKEV